VATRFVSIRRMLKLRRAAAEGPAALMAMLAGDDFDLLTAKEMGSGRTALHRAAEFGEVAAVRSLLSLGASVHTEDPQGLTPLHLAAVWGTWRCALLLLRRGADPRALTRYGDTPLTLAAANGQPEVLEVLLAFDRDALTAPTVGPLTPLEAAVAFGRHVAAQVLLAAGADPDEGEQFQPIAHAAGRYDWMMVRILMQAGARLDSVHSGQSSALHEAVAVAHATEKRNGVLQLLEFGVMVDARDGAGRTPLHLAAAAGSTGLFTASALLEYGADINARCGRGYTPLHWLALSTSETPLEPDLLQALLAAGADISSRDSTGATPLHLAVQAGETTLMQLLIREGAPLDATRDDGATPLHDAARLARENAVHLLMDNGADRSCRDAAGRKPADLAVMFGAPHVAEALKHGPYGRWPRITVEPWATRQQAPQPADDSTSSQVRPGSG
jgi:ankyrin repeat protein